MYKKTCEYCSIEFQAEKENARYCSGNCRQKAYLKRKKIKDSEIDGVNVKAPNLDVKSLESDFKKCITLDSFLLGSHQLRMDEDAATKFGGFLTDFHAFHPAYLPKERLYATEDITQKLINKYKKEDGLALLKTLQECNKIGSFNAQIVCNKIKRPDFGDSYAGLGSRERALVRGIFQKLLLFDRQKLKEPILKATADELKKAIDRIKKCDGQSYLSELLHHVEYHLIDTMNSKDMETGFVIGLSLKLRQIIQKFLMTV